MPVSNARHARRPFFLLSPEVGSAPLAAKPERRVLVVTEHVVGVRNFLPCVAGGFSLDEVKNDRRRARGPGPSATAPVVSIVDGGSLHKTRFKGQGQGNVMDRSPNVIPELVKDATSKGRGEGKVPHHGVVCECDVTPIRTVGLPEAQALLHEFDLPRVAVVRYSDAHPAAWSQHTVELDEQPREFCRRNVFKDVLAQDLRDRVVCEWDGTRWIVAHAV